MVLNINFSPDYCDAILSKCGYVTETVTASFPKYMDSYGKNDEIDREMFTIDVKVAYKKGKRPSFLDKDVITTEECSEFRYERVVEDVFNKMLLEKLEITHGLAQ